MRSYRLVFILKSNLKKEKKQKVLSDIKKWAGEVSKEELKELGEKKLAYPIKMERMGEYMVSEFEAEKVAEDLEKKILMQEEILRHLLVRTK